GAKAVAAGVNPMDLKRGIDRAIEALVADLEKNSKKITSNDEVAQVATISANGDAEIGRFLADAMKKVGNDGVITGEEAKSRRTESRGGESARLRRSPQGDAAGHRHPDRRPDDISGSRYQAGERDHQHARPRQERADRKGDYDDRQRRR